MKIGIIGSRSKRYKNCYREILKKLKASCVLWNRTKIDYELNKNETDIANINDLNNKELDLILCFIPANKNYDVLSNENFDTTVLIETPVEDKRWVNFNKFKVGVLEQWPLYPLEQFKHEVYKTGIISPPYQLFNDGRSFDYHAIAQLRSFTNNSKPLSCVASYQNFEQPGFYDANNSLIRANDDWSYGIVKMDSGATILCLSVKPRVWFPVRCDHFRQTPPGLQSLVPPRRAARPE